MAERQYFLNYILTIWRYAIIISLSMAFRQERRKKQRLSRVACTRWANAGFVPRSYGDRYATNATQKQWNSTYDETETVRYRLVLSSRDHMMLLVSAQKYSLKWVLQCAKLLIKHMTRTGQPQKFGHKDQPLSVVQLDNWYCKLFWQFVNTRWKRERMKLNVPKSVRAEGIPQNDRWRYGKVDRH